MAIRPNAPIKYHSDLFATNSGFVDILGVNYNTTVFGIWYCKDSNTYEVQVWHLTNQTPGWRQIHECTVDELTLEDARASMIQYYTQTLD
ncbi:hypothetical protein Lepto7375DRAFT_7266 [Leptolyngbya sp. PCC 7375]|nr:hypothetical protein Lepto7375DRAFT_7266 [Leptolyngbya sp. PCC 7375]